MKLICPSENLMSKKIKFSLKKMFKCKFSNLSQDSFDKIFHNYEIILLRFSHKLKFKKKNNIKYILSPTTGINHIDKKYFSDKKIKIITLQNEKKFLSDIAASTEFTITLILISLRKIKDFSKLKKRENFIGGEIYKKKVGIIGLGRIGNKVSKILKAFGASVYSYDIENKKNNFSKITSLNYILENCDVITINIPLNKKNYNFLNRDKLKKLKKNCLLINTSRGEVVDEKQIIRLVKKKLIFYSTDVIKNEHKQNIFTLKNYNKFDNFIYTNHIAGLTNESILKTDNFILNKFKSIYEKY
jgi:D-3-phosphoglycerate dehydrogenase